MKKILSFRLFIPLLICFLFFVIYGTLGIIRQLHFLSGYDLAVADQAMWKYSQFHNAISTNHAYAFTPILWDHVELIYPLLVPFYWIYSSVYTLILLQAFAICSSGLAIFLLAKKHGIKTFVAFSLLVSYFMFYGIQNAIWSDVHSLVFGVSFLAWFVYFVDIKKWKLSWLFFILTLLCKEDMALLTLLISLTLLIVKRDKTQLGFIAISILYLYAIFFVYFPYFVPGGYRFQNHSGLLTHLDPKTFYDTQSKKDVLFYSILSYGFLPLLCPIYLLAALGDVAKYFIIGNTVVSSGQSIFGHYRSSLALLLIWPTIVSIGKYMWLNRNYVGIYLLIFAFAMQYSLHSPLSYFAKRWFWTPSPSVTSMNTMIHTIPTDASVVTQINILPHMSHRNNEFIMWPETKSFSNNSPCGKKVCNWFRWVGNPHYMIIDTSSDWDIRYWLTTRENFTDGVENLQRERIVKLLTSDKSTHIYEVLKNPSKI